MKKQKKQKKPYGIVKWLVTGGISLVLVVALLVGNTFALAYEHVINIALGTTSSKVITEGDTNVDTEYFKSVYADQNEVKAAGKKIAEEVTEEGAVLLKNENHALPISKDAKVSLFGHSSVNMIVCGTGSADIDASEAPTFKEALESRGPVVNPSLWSFYMDNIDTYATNPEKGDQGIRDGSDGVTKGSYTVNEIPWDVYTDAAKSEFEGYADAAIVVISRLGGEMYDLPASTANATGNATETVDGSGNSLELTIQERQMLKAIEDSGLFSSTIVLINSTNALECDFVNEAELGVDACMWIGYTGVVGLYGVSDLLVGNSNPSGRLVDTYCVDNTTSPAHVNIYGGQWTNAADYGTKMFDMSLDSNKYYNVYQEGIYVGYRYYETRYEDYVLDQGNHGSYNYAADVAYPFGYGLSYTQFEYGQYTVTEAADSFTVELTVTNTGNVAGKEVVEVYFQSPYTDYDKENGIEKAAIELCGFAKTQVLEPGASEKVTINVPKKELRTYDANGAKTYILDAGDYYIAVGRNAHDALNNVLSAKGADITRMVAVGNGNHSAEGTADLVWKWNNPTLDTTTYAVSYDGTNGAEGYAITNQFDDGDLNKIDGGAQPITYLSRSDWEGTFPKTAMELAMTDAMWAQMPGGGLVYAKDESSTLEMPTMGADNGLKLIMMRGLEFNDPKWEKLLDQVTYEEMANLIGIGYHGTKGLVSVDKPRTVDENGPQGFTMKLTDVLGNSEPMTAYSDENIMAATYNTELIYRLGEQIGEDGLALGIVGLYGPAMNTHRSPYAGRNFEYYSEDGFLAGTIATQETLGIQSKGIYVYLKHFALNDSETHCRCISIFSNEQAIREIYLEAFEKPVVEGDAYNVMNSFARIGVTWTGAHAGLMTNVLRNEWGMRGFALTDYSNTGRTFDIKLGVLAGTDSWDCSASGNGTWSDKLLKWESQADGELTWAMRQATHRILYTVVNSAAMNGMSDNSRVVNVTPWWMWAIRILIGLFAALAILSVVMIVLNLKKRKALAAAPAEEAPETQEETAAPAQEPQEEQKNE